MVKTQKLVSEEVITFVTVERPLTQVITHEQIIKKNKKNQFHRYRKCCNYHLCRNDLNCHRNCL